MKILLLRPKCQNERFGLGPFFRVEPLGLEYVASTLLTRGHDVQVADLRFEPSLEKLLLPHVPDVVGIACLHAVDIPDALDLARRIRVRAPDAFILVGGHSASVFPEPFYRSDVDAVCIGDRDTLAAEVVERLCNGASGRVDGVWYRGDSAVDCESAGITAVGDQGPVDPCSASGIGRRIGGLDPWLLPARHLVKPYRRNYLCVHKQPVWAVETARGCPYRCTFCSTWRRHARRHQLRDIDTVCRDLQAVGGNVFIVDDLFWYPRERSLELARELNRRGVTKDWILVQSRLDTVAENTELLEAWRPLARQFDVFLGFEAPTDAQLAELGKDLVVSTAEEGVRVARRFGYGGTGNFVVDPRWEEQDFEAMRQMVDRLGLDRLGYTVLTPMPGTELFERLRDTIVDFDWSHYDMHHVLNEPRLGRERFFQLFADAWRHNVLSSRYSLSRWWRWLGELTPGQIWVLLRVLIRTQRLVRVSAYLAETFPRTLPAAMGDELGTKRA